MTTKSPDNFGKPFLPRKIRFFPPRFQGDFILRDYNAV
jgi:hypothetical protein